MMNREKMIEACVKHDTDWLQDGASRADMEDLMRNGWEGWVNMSDEAIKSQYEDIMGGSYE
jgi:hypothetical protein